MLYLILIFILYGYILTSLSKKNNTNIFVSFLLFNIFYDWLFIQLGYSSLAFCVQPLKILYELILIYLYIKYVGKKHIDISPKLKYVIIPLLYGTVLAVFYSFSSSLYIKGVRMFFEPILAAYVLYKSGLLEGIVFSKVSRLFASTTILMLIYSLYQYNNYKSVGDFWFYHFFDSISETSLDNLQFNYFRNGVPRCPSFLTSSISASLFYSFMFLYFYIVERRGMLYKFVLLCSLYGLYLSNTRIGFLVMILGFGIYFIKTKFINLAIMLPIVAIALTFISLLFGYYEEDSALSRVIQFGMVLDNNNYLGYGLADANSVLLYDSYILSVYNAIGMFIFVFLYFFYSFVKSCKSIESQNKRNGIVTYGFILTLCFIYIIVFQFFAGDVSYKIFCLIFFASYSVIGRNNIKVVKTY